MTLNKNTGNMGTTKQNLELDAKHLLNRISFHATEGIHIDSDQVCVFVNCWQSEIDKSYNAVISLLPLKNRDLKFEHLPISILGWTSELRLYCFEARTDKRGQAIFSNLPNINYLITTPDYIVESKVESEGPRPTKKPAVRTRGTVKVTGKARRLLKEFRSHDDSILCQLTEMEPNEILIQFQADSPDLEHTILQYAFMDSSERIIKLGVNADIRELRGFVILCRQNRNQKYGAELTVKLLKPLSSEWKLIAFPVTLEQLSEQDLKVLETSFELAFVNETYKRAWKDVWHKANKSLVNHKIRKVFEEAFK